MVTNEELIAALRAINEVIDADYPSLQTRTATQNLKSILRRADEPQAEQRPEGQPETFEEAVREGLIAACIYDSATHDNDPLKAVSDLIGWNVTIALDPQVSSDAQALIDRGRAEQPKAEPWYCPHCKTEVAPIDVTYEQYHDHRHGGCGNQVIPKQPKAEPGVSQKYEELLMAVVCKYPGETRHQTALRYIKNAEQMVTNSVPCQAAPQGEKE